MVSSQFNIKEAKLKMSKSSRLRSEFKIASDHIKDRVISNVIEAKNQGRYKIDESETHKLVRVIEMAFEQGFIGASGQIEKSINEVLK